MDTLFMNRETPKPLDADIAKEADFAKDGYHKAMLDLGTFDHKVYGLPFSVSLPVGYYNMDLMAKAGITSVDLLPVHLCIGNHDDRPTLLNQFPELADENSFVQQVVPLSIGHAIVLDTWAPQSHAGAFCDARAVWLDKQLAQLDGPVWLFMHHNPVPLGIGPIDKIMLLDTDRFEATLAPYTDKIAYIFHGHCHLPLSGSLPGIPFSAPRGTNHAGRPDFGAKQFLAASDLPESYAPAGG